jgi:hypothetical protein
LVKLKSSLFSKIFTNDHGYAPLVKNSRSFPHSRLITGFVTRLIQRVTLVEQVLPTLPEHLSSSPVVSGVRVTRSVVLYACFVDRCLSFCTFSFGHCVVCSSSIYRFVLPLCYLQTLHVEQAEKALYCVHKLVRKDALPVYIQLLRLDSMIEPI